MVDEEDIGLLSQRLIGGEHEAPLPPVLARLDGKDLPAVEQLVRELAVQPLVQRRRDAGRGQQVRVHPHEVFVVSDAVVG